MYHRCLSCQLTSWHFFSLVTIFIIIAHILKCLLFPFSSGSQIFKQNNYNIRSMDLLDIPTKDSFTYWKQNVGSPGADVLESHSNPAPSIAD